MAVFERDEWVSWSTRPIPEFNFTRQDLLSVQQSGGSLSFSPLSSWLPSEFVDAVRFSIEAILDPQGSPEGADTPSASWGASPLDYYHGHVVLPKGVASLSLLARGSGILNFCNGLQSQADGAGPRYGQAWTEAYARLLLQPPASGDASLLERAATLLKDALAEAAAASTSLGIIWHTFEWPRYWPQGMTSQDPRRHWEVAVPRGGGALFHPASYPANHDGIQDIAFVVAKPSGVITAMPNTLIEAAAMVGLTWDRIFAAL